MYTGYQTTLTLDGKDILLTSKDMSLLVEIIANAKKAGMISNSPSIRTLRVSNILEWSEMSKTMVRCDGGD